MAVCSVAYLFSSVFYFSLCSTADLLVLVGNEESIMASQRLLVLLEVTNWPR